MAILTNGTQTIEAGARTSVWRSVVNAALVSLDALLGVTGALHQTAESGNGLSGDVDGVNTTFVTPEAYIEGTLRVYVNGLRMPGSQIVETDYEAGELDFVSAPLAGSQVIVDYQSVVE